MEHPFFDSTSYPWSRPDAKKFFEVIRVAEKTIGHIQLAYDQSASELPALTPASSDLLWREVLNNLASRNSLRPLCEWIKNKFANNLAIIKAVTDLEQAKSAGEIRIFDKNIFILDCDLHRQAISKITSDSSSKVLLIRGNPKSGKSHCRYIFESIAREKNITVAYLYDGNISTVEGAITYIFSTLGHSADKIPRTDDTTSEAWYKEVCVKLKELATVEKKKLWIVVDDLGYVDGDINKGPILEKSIRRFFEQFTLFILDPSFMQFFRLLMINYPEENIPTKWKSQMWADVKTNENDIQQVHIEDFLKAWTNSHNINYIGQELSDLAKQIIEKADSSPVELPILSRLELIHKILELKLEEILKLK